MNFNSVFSISTLESPNSIGSILEKAKNGQEGALTEIYNLYFKKIYRFIYYRVSHKELAEDLAEDVFLKAFTKISSVKESQAFEGWLYQIARNKVIDYYREKKSLVSLDEVENTLEYESNVLDTVDLEQSQKTLLKFIKELDPQQQIVIKLKFFEELENPEIAEILNKSEGAIRVIQHRAIAKLQELSKSLSDSHE